MRRVGSSGRPRRSSARRSASIHELYMARGRGEVSGFTVPAVNLRTQVFDMVGAMCRAAQSIDCGTIISSSHAASRSTRSSGPASTSPTCSQVAIAAGWHGPVFVQGDHYQFNAKKYAPDAESTTEGVEKRRATRSPSATGTSTSTRRRWSTCGGRPWTTSSGSTTSARRRSRRSSARPSRPETTISIGGEIGEVGKQNSTEEELRAYLERLSAELRAPRGRRRRACPR